MQWIIDGNNLIHRIPALKRRIDGDPDGVRQQLVVLLAGLLGASDVDGIVVVFDGRGDRVSQQQPVAGVTLVYSPSHMSADAVIEQWVQAAPDPARCRVVTSDRMERDSVRAAGADSMPCGDFVMWMQDQQRNLGHWLQRRRKQERTTLGDFFPLGAPNKRGGD